MARPRLAIPVEGMEHALAVVRVLPGWPTMVGAGTDVTGLRGIARRSWARGVGRSWTPDYAIVTLSGLDLMPAGPSTRSSPPTRALVTARRHGRPLFRVAFNDRHDTTRGPGCSPSGAGMRMRLRGSMRESTVADDPLRRACGLRRSPLSFLPGLTRLRDRTGGDAPIRKQGSGDHQDPLQGREWPARPAGSLAARSGGEVHGQTQHQDGLAFLIEYHADGEVEQPTVLRLPPPDDGHVTGDALDPGPGDFQQVGDRAGRFLPVLDDNDGPFFEPFLAGDLGPTLLRNDGGQRLGPADLFGGAGPWRTRP